MLRLASLRALALPVRVSTALLAVGVDVADAPAAVVMRATATDGENT